MPLTIISRRNITYRETGRGEMTVLLVPSRDQIQVVKDLAGLGSTQAAAREAGAAKPVAIKKQIQLSRVHIGRRFIYGNLPTEISDLRQPVKVWLAEDYAPLQSHAFFYIFSNSVIIHGVREQDDEGYQSWRTAQLGVDENDPLRSIINAISDYALANPVDGLTVAVLNKLDLYEKLQAGLSTYNISPVPFSKLKPQTNLKPLYRHRDYTILYLTLALFGFITLLASSSYLVLTWMNLNSLTQQVEDIQAQIDAIKLNQNVGQVSDPQQVLEAMARPVNQQPSAIIHAAGESVTELGKVSLIRADFGVTEGQESIGSGLLNVKVTLETMNDELLLLQEQAAAKVLMTRPWVREIKRSGSVGTVGDMIVMLQIDQAPSATVPAPTPEMTTFEAPLDNATPGPSNATPAAAESSEPKDAGDAE